MKILLLSNQGMIEPFVGNPIMLRYRDALIKDDRVKEVQMLRCDRPFKIVSKLRYFAKNTDIIHIHFGGMYAFIVWCFLIGINKPKFITFHGTDIHAKAFITSKSIKEKLKIKLNQYASFFSTVCFTKCGFVAKEMEDYLPSIIKHFFKNKFFIQPLGVDYKLYAPINKNKAQDMLLLPHKKYILFSDVSNTPIKRRDIATSILKLIPEYELLIMCGVNHNDVPTYINACDALLLTSDQEGSPNIIREALSLNKPVLSVDVGDVVNQLSGLNNSIIISRDPKIAMSQIRECLSKAYTDNTRINKQDILDFSICSKKVIDLYESVI